MMKKVNAVSIILLISVISYGQNNYLEYHKEVNQAEQFFSEERFTESLAIYDSVFEKFDYVFVKDLLIASQIAVLNKNIAKTNEWLEKAIAQGYDCSCIEKFSVFEDYVKTQDL